MREVHHGDGLAWLETLGPLTEASIVTSLPDPSDVQHCDPVAWTQWFKLAAQRCAVALGPHSLLLFYQTDQRLRGTWLDKAALLHRALEASELTPVLHKIVLRHAPGSFRAGLASYSHLLGFAREPMRSLDRGGVDVLPSAGPTTWTRAMGLWACKAAIELVLAHTPTRTIVDPFCGHGTVLAVANALGLRALGAELGKRRAQKARTLSFTPAELCAEPQA